jgi:hypothetical protein
MRAQRKAPDELPYSKDWTIRSLPVDVTSLEWIHGGF